ncbi:MAG TPA: AMP-binding protein, partial [Solirubrobacterales bacterium]
MANSKVNAGLKASLSDLMFEGKVLREAGIVAPMRPDKALKIGGTFLRWGASPATGVTTAAIHYPHELAVVDERGALTWERLHRRSNALAHAFAEMGIVPGDGVGVMCRNHRGFLEATLASAKLGASALYLNTMFAGPQLAEVTRREGPKALVYDEEFSDLLSGVDDSVTRIVGWCDGAVSQPTLDGLIEGGDESNLKPPPDKPKFVILTSGTTGTPKGAQRSSPEGLLPIATLIDRIPFRSRMTMMIAAPLFHSWGFFHFVMSLPTASTMVLRRRFDPEDTLQAIEQSRADVLAAVPVMIQRILTLPDEVLSRYSLPSLKITSLSGSALPGEL